MTTLKHDIFNNGVVVSTPASEAGQARKSHFCNVPLETPVYGQARVRRFAPEIVVTNVEATEYYEDSSLHEAAEPGFATHLDAGFMAFEGAIDYETILDKWCRIQM